jgi:hypothetical protein
MSGKTDLSAAPWMNAGMPKWTALACRRRVASIWGACNAGVVDLPQGGELEGRRPIPGRHGDGRSGVLSGKWPPNTASALAAYGARRAWTIQQSRRRISRLARAAHTCLPTTERSGARWMRPPVQTTRRESPGLGWSSPYGSGRATAARRWCGPASARNAARRGQAAPLPIEPPKCSRPAERSQQAGML